MWVNNHLLAGTRNSIMAFPRIANGSWILVAIEARYSAKSNVTLRFFLALLFIWFEHIYETDVFVSITNQCVFISFSENGFSTLLCSICYINASIIVLLESNKNDVVLHVFTGCFLFILVFFQFYRTASSIFCFRLFVSLQFSMEVYGFCDEPLFIHKFI